MEGGNGFILLSVGLCTLICNVHSIKIYAANSDKPYEDISEQLEHLKSEKLRLETSLNNTSRLQPLKRTFIKQDIKRVKQSISKLENNSVVDYKDHLDMMEKLKNIFEEEKTKLRDQLEQEKDLQKQLEKADYSYKEATDQEAAALKRLELDNGVYKKKIDDLSKKLKRTEKEFAQYVEQQAEQKEIMSAKYKLLLEKKRKLQQKLESEKYQFGNAIETLTQKLEEAQNRYSRVLEEMSVNSQSNNTLVPIPHQDEINELSHNVHVLSNTGNRDGLTPSVTNEDLDVLLQKLYAEGKLSESTQPNELQRILEDVGIKPIDLRNLQIKRKGIPLRRKRKIRIGKIPEKNS